MPGYALLRYTMPMPDDGRIDGRNADDLELNGPVLSARKASWT